MTDEQQKPTMLGLESKVSRVKARLGFIAIDSVIDAQLLGLSYHFAEKGDYGDATIFGCLGLGFGYLVYTNGKKVVDMYRKAAGRGIVE